MKPRELSLEECIALLSEGKYGRLGLSINDMPYVIPISYVYFENRIYLHSRGGGKKVYIATKNPRLCFQVDILNKNCWSSVVVSGCALLSSHLDAKRRMYDIFTQKGLGGHGGKKFSKEELEIMDMIIWEIWIEEVTGKEGIW